MEFLATLFILTVSVGSIYCQNACSTNPCMAGMLCVVGTGGGYSCIANPCNPNPCSAGSTCSVSGTTYTCTAVNPCLNNACPANTNCVAQGGGYVCQANRCYGVTCFNNGVCNVNTGLCICPAGYTGNDCSVRDLCYGVNCNFGSCVTSTGQCSCNPGYSGQYCNIRDLCYGVNCNFGSCVSSTGQCTCNPGYSGQYCDITPAPCVCMNDGECKPDPLGIQRCECKLPYYGEMCENMYSSGSAVRVGVFAVLITMVSVFLM